MLNKVLCQTSKAFLITDKLLPPNVGLKNTRYKKTLLHTLCCSNYTVKYYCYSFKYALG